ncbi:MAG: hypothetical protein HOH65_12965 [Rhodospirillaceae bacterium]|nr:hypothetical protein [Rhodospirillaceae bacterium]
MFGSKIFEILTLRDGSWTIEATATSQEVAREDAVKLLNRPNVFGVRVIKESQKSISQLGPDDFLFEKLKPKTQDKIFIHDIDDAPLCDRAEDLLAKSGRVTINRLFRAYLDKNNLTATEVMHSAKEMKRLMDEGTLISSAVAKAAIWQAKKLEDSSTNERRDELFDFINNLNSKARAATESKLPRIRDAGFNETYDLINSAATGEDAEYLARVAIATELVDNRSYFGKLGQTMEWASSIENEEAYLPLDFYVSDILNNAEIIQDLIGNQSDMGSALVTLICLAEGEPLAEEMPEDLSPEHPEFAGFELNRLIADGKLPDSQSVLLDRVRRQLEGINPLSKGDREEEREVFHGLLDKLIPDINIIGGAAMAEAVTARQSSIINKGGNKGMKEATASVLPSLRGPDRKTGYLLALLESDIGQDLLRTDIDGLLDSILVDPQTVNHMVREKIPPNKKMEKLTAISGRISASNLPDERKHVLTSRLDDLLASYIVDGKILEKLDNPERPLHVRAFMLVSMVQPETLPRGKASELAREIIVKHLKRPNFEDELVAQIPNPDDKGRILRQFHEKLHRSGFFG